MLAARETPRFVELGRALYGSVEPSLAARARTFSKGCHRLPRPPGRRACDADAVAAAARDMIAGYRRCLSRFRCFRRDPRRPAGRPAGLAKPAAGVARYQHSAGASDGAAQPRDRRASARPISMVRRRGCGMFCSGLAGYEGMQEGLAVLAEYLVGGMTAARLRLIAARVDRLRRRCSTARRFRRPSACCAAISDSSGEAFNVVSARLSRRRTCQGRHLSARPAADPRSSEERRQPRRRSGWARSPPRISARSQELQRARPAAGAAPRTGVSVFRRGACRASGKRWRESIRSIWLKAEGAYHAHRVLRQFDRERDTGLHDDGAGAGCRPAAAITSVYVDAGRFRAAPGRQPGCRASRFLPRCCLQDDQASFTLPCRRPRSRRRPST